MVAFNDSLTFTPSYTPVEMFSLGIFGGSYFQIPTDLPAAFTEECKSLNLFEKSYDKKLNCYGVSSGSTLQWWLDQGLIHPDDPNGWVEWYVKFYYGRRHQDDGRQIFRFRAFITRHLAMLRRFEQNGKDSLKTKQNLLQWSWDHSTNPTW